MYREPLAYYLSFYLHSLNTDVQSLVLKTSFQKSVAATTSSISAKGEMVVREQISAALQKANQHWLSNQTSEGQLKAPKIFT